jgi:hypothetical protein
LCGTLRDLPTGESLVTSAPNNAILGNVGHFRERFLVMPGLALVMKVLMVAGAFVHRTGIRASRSLTSPWFLSTGSDSYCIGRW